MPLFIRLPLIPRRRGRSLSTSMGNLNPNNTLVGVDVLDDTLKLGNLRVIPKTLHRRKMSASLSLIFFRKRCHLPCLQEIFDPPERRQ